MFILAALGTALVVAAPAHAVTLAVSNATVSQPGEMATVCVTLDTGGQEVAGTQSDLVWDGTCATLTDGSCQVSPRHGKQLHGNFPPRTDFTHRALVFSLSDTDPIPDGELYCCIFGVEVTSPGACCPVNITQVGSSNSDGKALATRAIPGRLCLSSDFEPFQQPDFGGATGPLPGAGGVGGTAPAPAPDAALGAAGVVSGGLAAATPVVMLGGGGPQQAQPGPAEVEGLPAAEEVEPALPATPVTVERKPAEEADPARAAGPAAIESKPVAEAEAEAEEEEKEEKPPPERRPRSEEAGVTTPEAGVTAVPTTVAAADTPTVKSTPKVVRTVAPARAAKVPGEEEGWFGCQVGPGGGGGGAGALALIGIGVLFLALRRSRRWGAACARAESP